MFELKEGFEDIYGAVKIDYRENLGGRYYVYGFSNEQEYWDFEKGKFLFVTHSKEEIDLLKGKVFYIEVGSFFCKSCFKNKKVEQLKDTDIKYWGTRINYRFSTEMLMDIQDTLIKEIPEFNWSNVHKLSPHNSRIYYGVCSTYCLSPKNFPQSRFATIKEKVDNLYYQFLGKEIIKGKESALEELLSNRLSLIEDGLTLIECQRRIDGGIIDILARDSNNKLCIIELKTKSDDKSLIWQAAFYQTAFDEEDIRVITVAPNYSKKILNALTKIDNTEIKRYDFDSENNIFVFNYNETAAYDTCYQ